MLGSVLSKRMSKRRVGEEVGRRWICHVTSCGVMGFLSGEVGWMGWGDFWLCGLDAMYWFLQIWRLRGGMENPLTL